MYLIVVCDYNINLKNNTPNYLISYCTSIHCINLFSPQSHLQVMDKHKATRPCLPLSGSLSPLREPRRLLQLTLYLLTHPKSLLNRNINSPNSTRPLHNLRVLPLTPLWVHKLMTRLPQVNLRQLKMLVLCLLPCLG